MSATSLAWCSYERSMTRRGHRNLHEGMFHREWVYSFLGLGSGTLDQSHRQICLHDIRNISLFTFPDMFAVFTKAEADAGAAPVLAVTCDGVG